MSKTESKKKLSTKATIIQLSIGIPLAIYTCAFISNNLVNREQIYNENGTLFVINPANFPGLNRELYILNENKSQTIVEDYNILLDLISTKYATDLDGDNATDQIGDFSFFNLENNSFLVTSKYSTLRDSTKNTPEQTKDFEKYDELLQKNNNQYSQYYKQPKDNRNFEKKYPLEYFKQNHLKPNPFSNFAHINFMRTK